MEAAGFVTTPPRLHFDPPLDTASLQSRLASLCQSEPAALEPTDPCVPVTPLRVPFCEADLLRAYCEAPCDTLVITFGGLTQGYPGVCTPGSAQHEFVGVCKRLGVPHALFVRDTLQSWYLRGKAAASPHAALLELLRREINTLRPVRIVTIGASMGGCALAVTRASYAVSKWMMHHSRCDV